ncbi:hypothetical protein TSMEX_006053 [Taenia solium]|eukprot:TsM_000796000 transcript=TsM_000796000 gene=TsM_000796000
MMEYTNNSTVFRRPDLVKYKSLFSKFHGRLVVRKWNNTDLTHKYIIKYFMTTRSQSRFVVDIPVAETERFLKLIAEYNMTDQYYSYIFTDWDVQFVEPKIFTVDKGANFSTLSLMPMIPVNYDIAGELSGIHSNVEETPTYSRKSLVGSQTAVTRSSLHFNQDLLKDNLLISSFISV